MSVKRRTPSHIFSKESPSYRSQPESNQPNETGCLDRTASTPQNKKMTPFGVKLRYLPVKIDNFNKKKIKLQQTIFQLRADCGPTQRTEETIKM